MDWSSPSEKPCSVLVENGALCKQSKDSKDFLFLPSYIWILQIYSINPKVNYEILCVFSKLVILLHFCEQLKKRQAEALWGVGVLSVGDYSPHAWQVRPLNVYEILVSFLYKSCASVMILFTLLIWPGMKCSKLHGYRWVSVCGWESKKSCHIVAGISTLPQASFYWYQVK